MGAAKAKREAERSGESWDWRSPLDGSRVVSVLVGGTSKDIAEIRPDSGWFPDQMTAHARLIAAAPELLEDAESNASLLEMVADDLEELDQPGKAASLRRRAERTRATIAKARGES